MNDIKNRTIAFSNDRREFIKHAGKLSLALGISGPIALATQTSTSVQPEPVNQNDQTLHAFTLSILQTTDIHCQLHPHDELFWENDRVVFRKTGGYAHLASFFKAERKRNPDSLIIDTGDMFQGSELSVKTTGKAMLPILNQLGYDLFLPGNWEVVYYKKVMQSLLGALNAPKICANMYHDLGKGQRGELIFPPYYIWHHRGIKIGFLGYTDPLVPLRQSPDYSKGIIYTIPEDNLAFYIDLLRNQEQCIYVIMLAHLGLSQQIHLANQPACKGVDYILGGDTHERVRTPIQCKYCKVVEPGAFGSFAGRLDLQIANGKVIQDTYTLVEIAESTYPKDPEIAAIIDENEAPFKSSIQKIIGYSTIPLYRYFVVENPIDTLILQAIHAQMKEVDIILSNGFRFCPPLATPDHTGNFPITEGYLFDMLPVDSTLKTGSVSGHQIREWLEKELHNVFAENAVERLGGWLVKFSGMEIQFKAFEKKGSRLQEVKIGGELLDKNKTYSVCACEREGDPIDTLCRLKGVASPKLTSFTLHQVVKSYLATNSPVTPRPPMAAKILDAPQSLLTQVHGLNYSFR